MKQIILATVVIYLITLSSCGTNEAGGPSLGTSKPNLPALSTPSTTTSSPALPTGYPAAPIIASARLNPAHGQPGHRCDIAVGAVLPPEGSAPNLKLLTPTAPVLNTPVQNTPPVVQPQAVAAVAAGLNPAHGQPGHRCDIPVGQPLNSKPQTNNQTATTVTPAITTPLKPDTLFAKGLNPAHGQPGHRCDIAVGQPLNSAAKKS